MLIKDLKRQIEYEDDDVEVMVADGDKFITTPLKVSSANVQLLFHPPVETEPNKFRMELLNADKPVFIINTISEDPIKE